MKILLVEDDEPTVRALTVVLTEQQYVVETASDGQIAWELIEAFTYDLILLDVVLPKLDGIHLCQRLRAHRYTMPVLLLTAKDSITDKIMGLNAGADDYVVKPFDVQELLARVRVLLRRGTPTLPTILEWGKLRLNPVSCEVTYEDKLLNLSPKEYQLIELFLRNPQRVFSRSAILEHLWSIEESPNEGTITSHVMGLRNKIKSAGATDLIETVYGLGYRLKSPAGSQPTKTKASKKAADREKTLAAMSNVWEQFKPKIQERVKIFDRVTDALDRGTLDAELQQQAAQEAHKLAGSLGMFGFTQGTQIARALESLLLSQGLSEQDFSEQNSSSQVSLPTLVQLTQALKHELEQSPSDRPQSIAPDTSPNSPPAPTAVVLLVDDDVELGERLRLEATTMQIHIEIAVNLTTARRILAHQPPDAVLLDLALCDQTEDGFSLLSELANHSPTVPVLVLSASDRFSDRLEAARLGSTAFLQKPIPPAQVLGVLKQLLQQKRRSEATVLTVDDDPAILEALKILLEPWGLQLVALKDSENFWPTLDAIAPDLLILDVELPTVSGIELCQVVRNDLRWCELPILFLTGHRDADTVHRIFAAGADDFVSKPIIAPELVARVMGRLERSRLLRQTYRKQQ